MCRARLCCRMLTNLNNMQNIGNVIYQITQADLKEFAMTLIEDTKKELEEKILADKMERYMSPKDVAEMLGVNPSTLWRWSNSKYLTPSNVGGKKRYKYSDIKKLLEGGGDND